MLTPDCLSAEKVLGEEEQPPIFENSRDVVEGGTIAVVVDDVKQNIECRDGVEGRRWERRRIGNVEPDERLERKEPLELRHRVAGQVAARDRGGKAKPLGDVEEERQGGRRHRPGQGLAPQ